ncbi:MAG: UDP-glucose 4-epimerase GalE [Parachlamydiales bacterium]|nr:UDP-glucose 4-epimerase GalE [Parachlamydiales bacterium]
MINQRFNQNVLVTGGAGYIGSHTCKALFEEGYTPVVIDNLVTGHEWAVKWGPLEKGSFGDSQFITDLIARYNPIAILHFAASIDVAESVKDPFKYYQNNTINTFELLKVIKTNPIPFIFSSTCATYGTPLQPTLDENHLQNPINPYGSSKLMVEKMLIDASRIFNIPYTILRYFNACGADSACEIGESHPIETHLIPLTVQAALGQRTSLTVFGTDYETPDGSCIRDYIHVTDLANAHILALKRLLNQQSSECINLGIGHGYSVLEITELVKKITGSDFKVEYADRRAGDPAILIANASKALKLLRFMPKHSNLTNIIQTAWSWQLKESLACK